MSVVRGTALANYPALVAELGGEPAALLRAAAVRNQDAGNYDAFIPYRAAIQAIESAARTTDTPDFGRQLPDGRASKFWGRSGWRPAPPRRWRTLWGSSARTWRPTVR